MPELPEIESLKRKLASKIIKTRVARITTKRDDLRYPLPIDLAETFRGCSIFAVRRRSKYLLLDFDNAKTLVIHLGMSGRFFFTDPSSVLDKHDHVLIDLEDGRHLRLRDPRRFGMMFFCDTAKLFENRFFNHLGVEPLEPEFSSDYLFGIAKKSSAPIKSLLMNAAHVVGVGNIYANEALYLSGVRPMRLASKITKIEAVRLVENVKKTLAKSILAGGTTFRDYVDSDQKPGLYQVHLHVYGREGEPCLGCQSLIKRVIQVGRSSFYCPKCQR